MVDARKQLHWAVQLAAATADALMESLPDDSHTNLHWNDASSLLVGNPLPDGYRIAFKLVPFGVHLQKDGKTVAEFALSGHTLEEARGWLANALSEVVGEKRGGQKLQLKLRDYEMPEHPVATSAAFSTGMDAALDELGKHFANANLCLKAFADTESRATPVAVWPHHFDIGGIVILDPNKPFKEAPQIGFGMSPGDAQIDEPYYYITPWPLPQGVDLPELASPARWTSKAFTGALLLASDLIALDAASQEKTLSEFLRSAIDASIALLPDQG
tara:strand:- start:39656 stop:40474 length:819 start_codon:yes stop_codon:yes gene_type:complete